MADAGVRILDKPTKNTIATTDKVLVVFNAANTTTAQTALVAVGTLLGVNTALTDPASSSSMTIAANTVFITANYIYVATAANYLKRAALVDF